MKLRFLLISFVALAFGLSACSSSSATAAPTPPDRQMALNEFSDDWVLFVSCFSQATSRNAANTPAEANALEACVVYELKDLQSLKVPADTSADLQTFENLLQQEVNADAGYQLNHAQVDADFNKVKVDLGGSALPTQGSQVTPTP
jgi:hypothetical protein